MHVLNSQTRRQFNVKLRLPAIVACIAFAWFAVNGSVSRLISYVKGDTASDVKQWFGDLVVRGMARASNTCMGCCFKKILVFAFVDSVCVVGGWLTSSDFDFRCGRAMVRVTHSARAGSLALCFYCAGARVFGF